MPFGFIFISCILLPIPKRYYDDFRCICLFPHEIDSLPVFSSFLIVVLILLYENKISFTYFPALGAVSIWVLGLGLSCLLGLIVGIAVQPYIFRRVSVFSSF